MKQTSILLFVIFCITNISSQSFERVFSDYSISYGQAILPVENGNVIVGSKSGNPFEYDHEIRKFDSQGNLVFNTILEACSGSIVKDIAYNENFYSLAVQQNYCCDAVTAPYCALYQIDLDGSNVTLLDSFSIDCILGLSSDGQMGFSSSEIYTLDGDERQTVNTSFLINDVIKFSENKYLVVGKNTVGYMVRQNNEWTLQTNSIPGNHTKAIITDNQVLILSDNSSVQSLDYSLNPEEIVYQDETKQIRDFSMDNNQMIIAKSDGCSKIEYSFGPEYTESVFLDYRSENLCIEDIKVANNKAYVTGSCFDRYLEDKPDLSTPGINHPISTWVNVSEIPMTDFDRKVDAGISQLSWEEIKLEKIGYYYSKMDIINCEVEITNYGSSTLDSLNVNIHVPTCKNLCNERYMKHQVTLNDLGLAAGESLVYTIDTIKFNAFCVVNFYNQEGLCAYTSAPNGKVDNDYKNNQYCSSFKSSLKSQGRQVEKHKVYPNPALDQIVVESREEKISNDDLFMREFQESKNEDKIISIYDLQGKLHYQQNHASTNNPTIDIQSLIEGVYFVEICENGANCSQTKFIKM